MNLAQIKKYLPFLIGAIILIFIGLGITAFLITPSYQRVPAEQAFPDANEDYKKSFEKITEDEKAFYDENNKIATLRASLPYQGTNFTLKYSYSENLYTLTLKKGKETQANQELDQYLKNNGVSSREKLGKLYTDIR